VPRKNIRAVSYLILWSSLYVYLLLSLTRQAPLFYPRPDILIYGPRYKNLECRAMVRTHFKLAHCIQCVCPFRVTSIQQCHALPNICDPAQKEIFNGKIARLFWEDKAKEILHEAMSNEIGSQGPVDVSLRQSGRIGSFCSGSGDVRTMQELLKERRLV